MFRLLESYSFLLVFFFMFNERIDFYHLKEIPFYNHARVFLSVDLCFMPYANFRLQNRT